MATVGGLLFRAMALAVEKSNTTCIEHTQVREQVRSLDSTLEAMQHPSSAHSVCRALGIASHPVKLKCRVGCLQMHASITTFFSLCVDFCRAGDGSLDLTCTRQVPYGKLYP